MQILKAENEAEVQRIADAERAFICKKRTDEEIISLMKNQITNEKKEYVEERKYNFLYCFPDYYKGYGGYRTLIGTRILPSLRDVENDAIKRHLQENGTRLNINLYFDFFKQMGFDKCKQLISYFCIDASIVERLSDEQIVSIYKAFPTTCLYEKEFDYGFKLSKRLRKLILENKYTEKIKKKEEITKLFNGVKTFIDIRDAVSLSVESSDIKYIVENCDIDCYNNCSNYLSSFLSSKQSLIDDEIKEILFNKIQKLDDYKFKSVICDGSYIEPCSHFCFKDVLNEKQLNAICCRLYNIIGEKNLSYDKTAFNEKDAYVLAINKNWNSSSKEKQEITIINEIIKEMIELGYKNEEVQLRMRLIYDLIGDKKILFGKRNLGKIFYRMKKYPQFLYSILDINHPNCNYKFNFIKDNIIDGIGEIEILKLLEEDLNSEKTPHLANKINQTYYIIKNIIIYSKKENENESKKDIENEELIKKLLNEVFVKQTEQLEKNKLYNIMLEFFEEDLFKYLDSKNKTKVLEIVLSKNNLLNYDRLVYLIDCGIINIDQFKYLWEQILNDESRFKLIATLFEENKYDKLDECFINIFNKYLNDNKLDYVRFVAEKTIRRWTDLEISYIFETESINNIDLYLKDQYRFTEEQWDKLFKHFYKMRSNPFVPFGFENAYYQEFDSEYKTITSGKKYLDGDLIDEKEKSRIGRLVKCIKKKAASDEEDFNNQPLPF